MTDPCWVETDEAEDVASSVRHALRCWEFIDEDPQVWKWIILALHSALQGACVCHLTTTTAPLHAVTKKNAQEWLTFFEESRTKPDLKPPVTHIMALPELLKAVRKCPGRAISISDSEFEWLKRIHRVFRNQFIHFTPCGWSFEVSGVAGIANLTSRIITDILNENWAFRHMPCERREAMRADLVLLAEISN